MSKVGNAAALDKVWANNAKSSGSGEITEHKKFSMAHPQKLGSDELTQLLNTFDLNNPDNQSNGSVKGKTKDPGGSFHITPGVIKFNPGTPPPPSYPPAYTPPANDNAPAAVSYYA